MEALNLPPFEYKVTKSGANYLIFDILRRKQVVLTPEEWVRQHFVHYLINTLAYPKSLISIERGTNYNKLQKRTDLCVYNAEGKPHLLVECKASYVPITQEVVRQVSTYNQTLRAPYLVITNGLQHYCWQVNFETRQFQPLQEIPVFASPL
ncbi:type I restriction and modification enzyme subunit R-like protein [Pontibacter ummariensis]|uniref:Type I restriction enzyme R protein N terminus (HSDR_N) n=1 Tax=Pontibacter ummariensis TaxID=1610492 RepID=A0A239JVN5_9BACT|nr:type I restriction enzyme HsdR N-terminal domain-containing protein [Pontibacter ummariensis]PRY07317.1 type I restriction and modification enzyme subunit R-like protein [Pontibacter ummariensis]SNT09779.1 Type I restriction enzyme R protein N terminus (HSDR_N) [Pontibacter ummariensis]